MVKKVQDVFVGDLNDTLRCMLWEDDIGELVEGKNYCLKRFIVRELIFIYSAIFINTLNHYISKKFDQHPSSSMEVMS